jgi:hypothetical protein
MPYWIFHFFSLHFVSFRFVLFDFVSFFFVAFRFVSFRSVSFRSVSFRFVWFRFVSFGFVSFRAVSFRFYFVSHFTDTQQKYQVLRIGECPSNSLFLKNNEAEAPKGPRPIVFKEWRDTRTFSNLKSTHCTLLMY